VLAFAVLNVFLEGQMGRTELVHVLPLRESQDEGYSVSCELSDRPIFLIAVLHPRAGEAFSIRAQIHTLTRKIGTECG
jgi:hypothetical protein